MQLPLKSVSRTPGAPGPADPAAGPPWALQAGRSSWSPAHTTSKSPGWTDSPASVTFLPAPDSDGVLGVRAHRHQQLSGGTEVDVVHPLCVEAPQHGEGVLGHGVPDVDGRRGP